LRAQQLLQLASLLLERRENLFIFPNRLISHLTTALHPHIGVESVAQRRGLSQRVLNVFHRESELRLSRSLNMITTGLL
jgi:hypothetical protein